MKAEAVNKIIDEARHVFVDGKHMRMSVIFRTEYEDVLRITFERVAGGTVCRYSVGGHANLHNILFNMREDNVAEFQTLNYPVATVDMNAVTHARVDFGEQILWNAEGEKQDTTVYGKDIEVIRWVRGKWYNLVDCSMGPHSYDAFLDAFADMKEGDQLIVSRRKAKMKPGVESI